MQVIAAGLNFADSLHMSGAYQEKQTPPFVPGVEFTGIVIEADPATGFAPGRRVMGQVSTGAYAEYVVAEASRLVDVPDSMPDDIAAGFFIPYGTAYCALVDRARLRAGETLLVLGAAGAVGLAAIEVGRALGARVIGAAGTASKLAAVRSAGADVVVDYANSDLRAAVQEVSGGAGVDVVLDTVGGDLTLAALRCLRFEGRLVLIGFTGGSAARLPANHVLVKNVDVVGMYWYPYQTLRPERIKEAFESLTAWYRDGQLKPRVAARFPLEDAGIALERLLAREFAGKVVIRVSSAAQLRF